MYPICSQSHRWLKWSIASVLIAIMASTSFSQVEDLGYIYRPVGIIFESHYIRPQFTGQHVKNQSFGNWFGLNFKIGFSVYNKAEISLEVSRVGGALVDRRYVFSSTRESSIRKASFAVPILHYKRLLYLSPDLAYGRMTTDLAGEITGNLFEIGNTIAFHASDHVSFVGRIAYHRVKYPITTNESLLPLFEVSHAIVPSLGIRFRSRITEKVLYSQY